MTGKVTGLYWSTGYQKSDHKVKNFIPQDQLENTKNL